MKFAFLIQRPGIGGLASMHDRLKEALEKRGHEVDKFIVQDEDVLSKVENSDYDVVHLYFTPFLKLKFFLRLLKFNLFSDKKVFVNYYNIKPENIIRRVVKRAMLPVVCTEVLLPSKNMEEFYREEIGISNTATLRPIVEEKFYNLEAEGDKIIYFGHSRPDKGIDRLMEISSRETPVHCYFIQDEEHVFQEHPGLEEKVEEKSIVLHDELPEDALYEAGVALFPFYNLEKTVDLPLALLESLAAGVPVLTSDLPPMNQYLPESFIMDSWDREKAIDKIEELSDQKYRDLARETAEDMELDSESVLNHYLDIIHGQDHR